jgi:tetratricopeptide (TPR) repeat protein
VAPKIALTEFLSAGMREAPAAVSERVPHLCRLWTSFEDHIRSRGMKTDDRLVSELQKSFFEKMAKEIEGADLSDISLIAGEIPYGYVLLQAGQYDQAIQHLQAAIAKTPNNAAIYGYLGDAYWLRGDVKTARKCYQEGCLIDPDAIDWHHIRDGELYDLREDLLFAYGFDGELATAWLPSYARASGLFERKLIRLHDGMKELVDDYVALQKSLPKDANPKRLAKLFLLGIILWENEEGLKLVRKIDLIEVRRVMKQVNPDLFGEVLTHLGKKRE